MVRVVALVLVRRFDGDVRHSLELRIPGTPPENNSTDWQDSYSFMSRHRRGANFAICDGSVHYVSQSDRHCDVTRHWPPSTAMKR